MMYIYPLDLLHGPHAVVYEWKKISATCSYAYIHTFCYVIFSTDPRIIHVTQNSTTFIKSIAELTAEGGRDCPEPSLGAIARAAVHSRRGAAIFLFTDVPPSDTERISALEKLLHEKSLTLYSVLTPGCSSRRGRDVKWRRQRQAVDDFYGYLAMVSGGQVFDVGEGDISELYSLVIYSFQPSSNTIFHWTGNAGFSGVFNVSVDSTITQLVVRISGASLTSIGLSTPLGECDLCVCVYVFVLCKQRTGTVGMRRYGPH